jgi:hypothetical protein
MDTACRCYAGAVPVPSPQTPRYLRLHNSPFLRNIDIKNLRLATCSADAHGGPAVLVAAGLLAVLRAAVPWRQQIARASPALLHPAAFFVAVDNIQVHAMFTLQGHGSTMTLQATAVNIQNQLRCAPPCRGQTQT